MEKSSSADSNSPGAHSQDPTVTPRNLDDKQGEKNSKVVKLEGQIKNGGEMDHDEGTTTTVIIGSRTMTGGFVQLPPELLTMILANLAKKSDLLHCRYVNKTWRVLTNNNLRQRNVQQIRLGYSHLVFRLNNCLEDSKRLFGPLASFPCTRFQFSDQSLKDRDLRDFLDLYGNFIKSLDLSYLRVSVEKGQLASLKLLLTKEAPNIEHLRLDCLKIHSSGRQLFDNNQIILPHLQTLDAGKLDSEQEKFVLEEIVGAAPNLRVCNVSNRFHDAFPQLYMLASKGKLQTWKTFKMDNHQRNIQMFERISDMQLKLESWSCYINHNETAHRAGFLLRVAAVINKILESSKDTLITIEPFYPLGRIRGIKFPVLDEMKKLNIVRFEHEAIFPLGLDLSKVFPNVKNVNLELLYHSSLDFWDKLFPFNFEENNWPTVHTLSIGPTFEKYIYNLSRLFPNLKHLVNAFTLNFSLACYGIFEHMEGLESLEFGAINFSRDVNVYPALDSALTGFSPEICRRLAESEDILDDVEVEELRENLSILKLTSLRRLKIGLAWYIKSLILSRASGLYAFQRMPQLKVTVTADQFGSPGEKFKTQRILHVIAPFSKDNGLTVECL